MPAKRLPMRKIREALRLSWGLGLTARQVAASLDLARSTVAEYVRRAEEAGLRWPLPQDCDDFILERRLFPPTPLVATVDRPLPDWAEVAQELGRKGVTLFLLWHEYKHHGRRDILEILEDRHDVRSTIVSGQLPVSGWHEMIGDPTLADAILDRLVHNAHKIELKGESMRKTLKSLTQSGHSGT